MLIRRRAGASANPLILSILAAGQGCGYAILQHIEGLPSGERFRGDGDVI